MNRIDHTSNSEISSNALTFEGKLIEVIYAASKRSPLVVILVDLFIFLLAIQYYQLWICIIWFVLAVLIVLARSLLVKHIHLSTNLNNKQKLRLLQILALINGIFQGLSILFFIEFKTSEQAIVTMLLVGLCSGAIFTTSGYKPSLYSFVMPVLIPLSLFWMFNPNPLHTWIEYYVGGLIFLFMVILFTFGNDTFNLIKDSIHISLEQTKLNKRLQTALQNEELANQAKTRFLAAASHDLRQPLHSLSIFSAALEMQKLDPKSKSISNNMKKALSILSSQLDSLLDISKIDAGVLDIKFKVLSHNELMSNLHVEFKTLAEEKGLLIELKQFDDIYINTDPIQYERLVRNIISNAIKYTDKGMIKIHSELKDDFCILKIIDTGKGISKNEQDKVFEEFYQLDNKNDNREAGLGLGLSIVKRLAKLLGIKISLLSEPGIGTEVSIISNISTEYTTKQSRILNFKKHDIQNLNILIIDDDEMIRKSLSVLLQEMNCKVKEADDKNSAMEIIQSLKPDLMLVDLQLKNNDSGLEIIKLTKELYPDVNALMITGNIDLSNLEAIKDANIQLLHKPVDANKLIKTIEQILKQGNQLHNAKTKIE